MTLTSSCHQVKSAEGRKAASHSHCHLPAGSLQRASGCKPYANARRVKQCGRKRKTGTIGKKRSAADFSAMRIAMEKCEEPDDKCSSRGRCTECHGYEKAEHDNGCEDDGFHIGDRHAAESGYEAQQHDAHETQRNGDECAPAKHGGPKTDGDHGKYMMDFEDLEEKAEDPDCTMMILCSPHNPVGRIWTKEELIKISDICLANNVLLVSDEIHFDLVFKGNKHISVANLEKKYKDNSIVCTAPSKTFNIAGLHSAYCIIWDRERMDEYRKELGLLDLNRSNIFSREVTQVVYEQGAGYVDNLVDFLEENMNYVYDFICENIKGIIPYKMEATYLMWLDCRGLGLDDDGIDDLFFNKAKIALDSGRWFGEAGNGFMRINIACPRSMLIEGMHRLKTAVENLQGAEI